MYSVVMQLSGFWLYFLNLSFGQWTIFYRKDELHEGEFDESQQSLYGQRDQP